MCRLLVSPCWLWPDEQISALTSAFSYGARCALNSFPLRMFMTTDSNVHGWGWFGCYEEKSSSQLEVIPPSTAASTKMVWYILPWLGSICNQSDWLLSIEYTCLFVWFSQTANYFTPSDWTATFTDIELRKYWKYTAHAWICNKYIWRDSTPTLCLS